ncbi:MAG: hypothetical protein HY042_03615 [Spirochaetia bacterium]|nr:hypothetical protein [Spirochaetia bacterium]
MKRTQRSQPCIVLAGTMPVELPPIDTDPARYRPHRRVLALLDAGWNAFVREQGGAGRAVVSMTRHVGMRTSVSIDIDRILAGLCPIPEAFVDALGIGMWSIALAHEWDRREFEAALLGGRFPTKLYFQLEEGMFHCMPLPPGTKEQAAVRVVTVAIRRGRIRAPGVVSYPQLKDIWVRADGRTEVLHHPEMFTSGGSIQLWQGGPASRVIPFPPLRPTRRSTSSRTPSGTQA